MKNSSLLAMKWVGFVVLCGLSFSPAAFADLQVEVLDFNTRQVRMIYEIEDTLSGSKELRFPGPGFIHDSRMGEIEVESVFNVLENFEMEYSMHQVGTPPAPQLRIKYQKPVPQGGRKTIRIIVVLHLPTDHIYQDSQSRYVFEYQTSHKFKFAVPLHQYLVFANQPVTVFEQARQVFVEQPETKSRRIKIMTRNRETPFN